MAFARYISFLSQLDSVDELPSSLVHALKEMNVEADSRVAREDEGWAVTFRHNGVGYRFCSRFDITSEPLQCMGWLERDTGFFASMFGARETNEHRDVEPIIHSALARLLVVRDPVWHSGDDAITSTPAA
jgi:hypothetical protein